MLDGSRLKKLQAGLSRPLLIKKKENLLYLTGHSFLHGYLLVFPTSPNPRPNAARPNATGGRAGGQASLARRGRDFVPPLTKGRAGGVVFFGDGLEKISVIPSDRLKNLGKYLQPGANVDIEDIFTLAELKYIKNYTKNPKFTPVPSPVDVLRAFKDKQELQDIGRAVALTAKVFNQAKKALREKSWTEIALANFIRLQGLKLGAQDVSFPPIVATGQNAAVPHHKPTERKIKTGESVVIDIGFKVNNYCSDFTRTVFLKTVPKKLEIMYRQTQKAQFESMRAAASGARASQIYNLARKILAQKNLDKYFIHGLGHGTGLEIHEWPRLSETSPDILRPGMVFSIEPGVYIPQLGGTRLEDLLYLPVDAKPGSRARLFSKVPTALEENVIK